MAQATARRPLGLRRARVPTLVPGYYRTTTVHAPSRRQRGPGCERALRLLSRVAAECVEAASEYVLGLPKDRPTPRLDRSRAYPNCDIAAYARRH